MMSKAESMPSNTGEDDELATPPDNKWDSLDESGGWAVPDWDSLSEVPFLGKINNDLEMNDNQSIPNEIPNDNSNADNYYSPFDPFDVDGLGLYPYSNPSNEMGAGFDTQPQIDLAEEAEFKSKLSSIDLEGMETGQLFESFTPRQIMEHLDDLTEHGAHINMEELVAGLNTCMKAQYFDQLSERGAQIDSDELYDELDKLSTAEKFQQLADSGFSANSIANLCDSTTIVENLDLLTGMGADIDFEQLVYSLPSSEVEENLEKLLEHGASCDLLCNNIKVFKPSALVNKIDILNAHGANLDLHKILEEDNWGISSNFSECVDTFLSHGFTIDELITSISLYAATENIETLLDRGASIDKLLSEAPSSILGEHIDKLIEHHAEPSVLIKKLNDDDVIKNAEKLIGMGASIDEILNKPLWSFNIIENFALLKKCGASTEALFNKLYSSDIVSHIDLLMQNGIDINDILNKVYDWDILEHYEELVSHGAEIDLQSLINNTPSDTLADNLDMLIKHNVSIDSIVENFDSSTIINNLNKLISHGVSLDKMLYKLSSNDIINNLDTLLSNGASLDKLVALLEPSDIADNYALLSEHGVNLGINPNQTRDEILLDFGLKSAEKKLDEGDYRGARCEICKAEFGVRLGKVCSDLVAFGAIDFSIEDRQEMRSFHGISPEDFFEVMFSKIGQVEVGNVEHLLDTGQINTDSAAIILEAIRLFGCGDDDLRDNIESLKTSPDKLKGHKMGEILAQTRKNLEIASSREYTDYMTEKIQQGTRQIELLDYDYLNNEGEIEHKKVPVLEMVGDEFMLLVHRRGGIYSKSDMELNDPSSWDRRPPSKFDKEGRPVGYVSTSAIGDCSLDVAGGAVDSDSLFYAFADLGENAFMHSAEYDLYVEPRVDEDSFLSAQPTYSIKADRQDFFYNSPHEVVTRTRDRLNNNASGEGYNEVTLDRYPGGDASPESRLRPSHLVFFGKSPDAIGDLVKKHAAYFGAPIVLIDPDKYGRRQNA